MQTKADNELLEAYASGRDDAAFAELARRYAGLVYGICRRLLTDSHEAEDACQAVFVALARRAGSLRRGGDLAGWLARVAHHVASKAVRSRVRRVLREEEHSVREAMTDERSGAVESRAELLTALELELAALPARFRQAVTLLHLQGFTQVEAAGISDCPVGTLGRLASEGVARLRLRLSRRGYALGGAALVSVLESEARSAVPETLLPSILATGKGAAAASPGVLALAQGALQAMLMAKAKAAAAAAVAVALLVGSTAASVTLVLPHATKPDRSGPATPAGGGAPAVSGDPGADAGEAGRILFRDSFEHGLTNWMLYTRQDGGAPRRTTEAECPDIRPVSVEQAGRRLRAAELVAQGAGGRRVGIRTRPFGADVDALCLSYEYTYDGRPRRAMEGLLSGMAGAFPQPARPPGEWNQVRWECVRKRGAEGRPLVDATLLFNGEVIGRTEYESPGGIDLVLEVIDGRFRFANVTIREMPPPPVPGDGGRGRGPSSRPGARPEGEPR